MVARPGEWEALDLRGAFDAAPDEARVGIPHQGPVSSVDPPLARGNRLASCQGAGASREGATTRQRTFRRWRWLARLRGSNLLYRLLRVLDDPEAQNEPCCTAPLGERYRCAPGRRR